MAQTQLVVNQDSPRAASEGSWVNAKGSKRGEVCVVYFYTAMALEGRAFQIRGGTIATGATADLGVVDQLAEMAVEAPGGLSAIPCYLNLSIPTAAGTVNEAFAKSRPWTVAITGTAQVPLPLRLNGVASRCSGYFAAEGGVDVGANESLTLDRLHWSFSQPIAMGAWDGVYEWIPPCPSVVAGHSIFYVQIGATTTALLYFCHFDYIELPTINLS